MGAHGRLNKRTGGQEKGLIRATVPVVGSRATHGVILGRVILQSSDSWGRNGRGKEWDE